MLVFVLLNLFSLGVCRLGAGSGNCTSFFGGRYLSFRGDSVIFPLPSVLRFNTGSSSDDDEIGTRVGADVALPMVDVVPAGANFLATGQGCPVLSKGGMMLGVNDGFFTNWLSGPSPPLDEGNDRESELGVLLQTVVAVTWVWWEMVESGRLSAGNDNRLGGVSLFRNFMPVGISSSFQS